MDRDYEVQREAYLLCPHGTYEKLDENDKKHVLMMAEQRVNCRQKLIRHRRDIIGI